MRAATGRRAARAARALAPHERSGNGGAAGGVVTGRGARDKVTGWAYAANASVAPSPRPAPRPIRKRRRTGARSRLRSIAPDSDDHEFRAWSSWKVVRQRSARPGDGVTRRPFTAQAQGSHRRLKGLIACSRVRWRVSRSRDITHDAFIPWPSRRHVHQRIIALYSALTRPWSSGHGVRTRVSRLDTLEAANIQTVCWRASESRDANERCVRVIEHRRAAGYPVRARRECPGACRDARRGRAAPPIRCMFHSRTGRARPCASGHARYLLSPSTRIRRGGHGAGRERVSTRRLHGG